MAKEIQLTQGKVAIVDDEDFERVSAYKWCAFKTNTGSIYAFSSNHVLMHRFILGVGKGAFVDHKDGDGLNNRRENIRLCTNQQNQMNRRAFSCNKIGLKGVRVSRSGKRYRAYITLGGKVTNIGTFATAEAAARAYDAKARELFGEFARCNFEE